MISHDDGIQPSTTPAWPAGSFDFHLHTDRSDGHISPERLWRVACERGLTGISITDHDTVDAYDDLDAVPRFGAATQPLEPWLLPGLELSTSTNGEELHVLAYFSSGFSSQVLEFVESVLLVRERRMLSGIRRLRERGIDISVKECRAAARGRVVSRTHLAELLLRKRYVQHARQAYRHLLGPAVFPSSGIETASVVATVRDLGGVSVWAHPKEAQLDPHLEHLAAAGLDGIEAYTPWRRSAERSRILRRAKAFGLLATAGSDWHGQPESPAGRFSADASAVGEFLVRVRDGANA